MGHCGIWAKVLCVFGPLAETTDSAAGKGDVEMLIKTHTQQAKQNHQLLSATEPAGNAPANEYARA